MNAQILRDFLNILVRIRTADPALSADALHAYDWDISMAFGFLVGLRSAFVIDAVSQSALEDLIWDACAHRGEPFPSRLNAGPFIWPWDLRERNQQVLEVVHVGSVEVPASAASCGLRLLCLLVPSRDGKARSLPVHTVHRVPPHKGLSGRYYDGARSGSVALDPLDLSGGTGFYLRETHARTPSAAVLVRMREHWQASALRADSRALRAGGLSHAC
jgi:hypothetical protein